MNKTYLYTGSAAGVAVLIILGWFFFRPSSTPQTSTNSSGASLNNNSTSVAGQGGGGTNNSLPVSQTQSVTQQKIFAVAQGPVVDATIVQTLHPTTTLARYISAQDGHVYDLPLDVPGAVPRVISNTTIPGGYRAVWLEGGAAAALQYLENGVVKTVYLGFPASSGAPTRVQYLPDNITSLAASPDSKSVAYLLTTSSGSDGYVASSNGTGAKKLFSLPLSQVLISWPSPGTLLVTTKAAAGVPGVAFAVDAKSGSVLPLVYAQGLVALANQTFSHVIYQTSQTGAAVTSSYDYAVQSGSAMPMSFNPNPEGCIFGALASSVLYCAAPLTPTAANYVDLWHEGVASAPASIVSYNVALGSNRVVAVPGSQDGGSQADMFQMAISPDDHYLLYVTKGDRALWGVRLTQ
jgi:hypothetical protein